MLPFTSLHLYLMHRSPVFDFKGIFVSKNICYRMLHEAKPDEIHCYIL